MLTAPSPMPTSCAGAGRSWKIAKAITLMSTSWAIVASGDRDAESHASHHHAP